MNENTRSELRSIERRNAEAQIGSLRSTLGLIGQDLSVKGACLVDESARGLVAIATELEKTAAKLRTISVLLNGSTVILGEHIAEEARGIKA